MKIGTKVRLRQSIAPFHNVDHNKIYTVALYEQSLPTFLVQEAKHMPYHIRLEEHEPIWPDEPNLGLMFWVGYFEEV